MRERGMERLLPVRQQAHQHPPPSGRGLGIAGVVVEGRATPTSCAGLGHREIVGTNGDTDCCLCIMSWIQALVHSRNRVRVPSHPHT